MTTKHDVWCGEEVDDKILRTQRSTKLAKCKAIVFSVLYGLFLLKSDGLIQAADDWTGKNVNTTLITLLL